LLDDVFAISDLSQFVQQVDLEFMTLMDQGSRETWLAVDPGKHDTVVAKLNQTGFEDWIVGDSRVQLEVLQNNLVFREVTTAFALNALILIPLSVVGFFLIQLFSTHRRAAEFNVLQVMGLSKTQLRGVLILEGFIFISVGVLIGVGVGFGLTIVMQPFLSQILPPLRGGIVLDQILINWSEVVVRFAALIGFYGIGYFILLISAFHNQRSAQF
jgi:ABC-type antimicrobial peptide transport system permease subunit